MNPAGTWLAPPAGTDPATYWSGAHASALAGTLDRRAIALADDVDLLPARGQQQPGRPQQPGLAVIVTAGFGPAFQERVPLAPLARSQGRAVLIRPRGPLDGDLFGVRFETDTESPAGARRRPFRRPRHASPAGRTAGRTVTAASGTGQATTEQAATLQDLTAVR